MRKVPELKLQCNNCQKVFYRKPYAVRTKKVYCSHKCQTISNFPKGHPVFSNVEGARNHDWRGEKVGYRALHDWVQRHKGKAIVCVRCGSRGGEKGCFWANLSGAYLRELSDWQSLCPKCNANDGIRVHSRFIRDSRGFYVGH